MITFLMGVKITDHKPNAIEDKQHFFIDCNINSQIRLELE
jgi:hypothetical protein